MLGRPWSEIEPEIQNLFNSIQNPVVEEGASVSFAVRESLDLAKALCLVWLKERAPYFLKEYRPLAIEPEIRSILYENDQYQVVLLSRLDAIIERLSDGALIQWELKTKPSVTSNWINSWEHNYQLIAQQVALKTWAQAQGLQDRPIVGAYIEALIKGKREKDSSGVWRNSTPLIYAYVQPGDGLMVPDRVSQTWKKGWSKELVSTRYNLQQWIFEELSSEVTAPKAVVVPPIKPSLEEIATACEQWGQAAIADYEHAQSINRLSVEDPQRKMLLNKHFIQNTEHCYRYGRCEYLDYCFNSSVEHDPLSAGYAVRVPNHPENLDDE